MVRSMCRLCPGSSQPVQPQLLPETHNYCTLFSRPLLLLTTQLL